MTAVDASQQDGTNPEVSDDNVSNDATHDEGNKGIKKLLNQRNEARQEADEYKSKYEELVNSAIDQKFAERDGEAEKQNFKAQFGQEALDQVNGVLEKYPNISVEDAYKIANPQAFASTGQSFNIKGNTPTAVMRDKQVGDLSIAELKEKAKAEFMSSVQG